MGINWDIIIGSIIESHPPFIILILKPDGLWSQSYVVSSPNIHHGFWGVVHMNRGRGYWVYSGNIIALLEVVDDLGFTPSLCPKTVQELSGRSPK